MPTQQLRALKVQYHPHGPRGFRLQRADGTQPLGVIFLRTVTEIEPKYVDPGIEQAADRARARARRPERGDDLGIALPRHAGSLAGHPDCG